MSFACALESWYVQVSMARLRIAHFSDIHYTLSPWEQPGQSLRGKRLAGCFSYYLGGRRERFANSPERIAALLRDVDESAVDHALCTGDLTAVSLPAEFAGLARVFGARLEQPERFTVLPGNHDRYVATAVRDGVFERHFGTLCPGATTGFPFSKRVAQGVRIVGIDAARPTGFTDASGLCGDAQIEALRHVLAADLESATIVAMHYGLLRWRGDPDKAHHRMRDWDKVLAVLDASPARIALVLHGHMHGAFTARSERHTILCSGSAIDLLVDCGYFIYEIDLDSLQVAVERRHWNRLQHRYEPRSCAPFEAAVREQRGAKLALQAALT